MVLLIPKAWNRAKEEGRREERDRASQRLKEAYERFGIEVDGVLVLPRTPEVERFLAGEGDERS